LAGLESTSGVTKCDFLLDGNQSICTGFRVDSATIPAGEGRTERGLRDLIPYNRTRPKRSCVGNKIRKNRTPSATHPQRPAGSSSPLAPLPVEPGARSPPAPGHSRSQPRTLSPPRRYLRAAASLFPVPAQLPPPPASASPHQDRTWPPDQYYVPRIRPLSRVQATWGHPHRRLGPHTAAG
jgi:hypothetical protein